jgi:hypothetical protein
VTAPYRSRGGPKASGTRWRRILLLVILAALLAVTFLVTRPHPPATLPPTLVLSGVERAGDVSLARDCGYSAPLPANPRRSLWLFCDTPVYVRHGTAAEHLAWTLRQFITGSTAAVGRAVVGPRPDQRMPGQLGEVGSPRLAEGGSPGNPPAPSGAPVSAGTPASFLWTPGALVSATGRPCGYGGGSYAASWITGLTRLPATPDLLIAFNNYCVMSGTDGFLPEGFGLAEYDPATGTVSHDSTVFSGVNLIVAPAAKLLGSPVFSGSYLYLFGPTCTALAQGGCATGTLFEARVPASPQAWTDPLSYQWQSSKARGSWTSDPLAATSVVPGARPSGVSVAAFPATRHHFVLVEQTDISGGFTVYGSPVPSGPWTQLTSGRVPCRTGTGFANFCRAIIAHPELSTASQLVLSYFDPGAGARGHVMVAGFSW